MIFNFTGVHFGIVSELAVGTPSLPSEGGEGREEEVLICELVTSPLPNPLPVRRGEGVPLVAIAVLSRACFAKEVSETLSRLSAPELGGGKVVLRAPVRVPRVVSSVAVFTVSILVRRFSFWDDGTAGALSSLHPFWQIVDIFCLGLGQGENFPKQTSRVDPLNRTAKSWDGSTSSQQTHIEA